ncbi:hypothetical protein B0I35DRAFT_409212 [Stachybotrys elegans]|uniref:Uncharacterized protein n=1 Tax=Stachybotrys elegans TaxID=80388 RepID=A0A8K0SPS6_9HYPO|nr:hypothetical protein B0I35DRAFT_409212 [Stachybotrys elegans]
MSASKLLSILALASSVVVQAQRFPKEDLILCDCGIGDYTEHPEWSTSRQMNWYQNIAWPESGYAYPDAPDMAVQVPYRDGIYPWVPAGATATFSNGDVWSAYIEDGTPNGYIAGRAVTTKEGGQSLNCWAYRGRPVSAALNKTVTDDAVCWSAFVCNRDEHAPPVPKDMESQTSSKSTSVPPSTTFYSGTHSTTQPSPTGDDPVPAPTQSPPGGLFVDVFANPRFITWQASWNDFLANFVWDESTGKCISKPVRGSGYEINIECAGIQLDQNAHLTLILIQSLRQTGLKSLWFNQNPVVPGSNSTNGTATDHWVVMPEAFSLRVTDIANDKVIGYLGYSTNYDGFITGPCSTCDTERFNKDFFDPIIEAMQGTYPYYDKYTVQGQCDPWMECK